jgi:drug/metabolite transporter (DMT)-like permease
VETSSSNEAEYEAEIQAAAAWFSSSVTPEMSAPSAIAEAPAPIETPDSGPPDRATLVAFLTAVLIGGGNFVAVKFSNEELPPFFGAALRFSAAMVLFFVLMYVRRLPLPRGRALLGAALYGLLGFGFAYALLYYALVGLSAGTSSVILASTPLATLLLAVLHRQERFTTRGLLGGLLAIAGIGILSADTLGGDVRPIYLVSALLGSIAIAESSVVVKGFPSTHPITTNAVAMVVGSVFLAIASLLFGEQWMLPQTTQTWLVLAYLVVAGTVVLFILFLVVIIRWTASATVYVLTLMPVVAVTLGVLFMDEKVSIQFVVGSALVLTAVYIGALAPRKPEPRPT